jgi:hypothetical protein
MSKTSFPSAKPVTVICTNHLTPEQTQRAWDSLVRDVLLPRALREETLLATVPEETPARQREAP